MSREKRLKIKLTGIVQGIGFRPFVYKLARNLQLTGWVNNSATGVFIEVEGKQQCLELFLERLEREKPRQAKIESQEINWLNPIGYDDFTIRSSVGGEKTAITLPDLSTCTECLREIFTPGNRRYRYPFTNCTNCGPRYSIIQGLPYDRPQTTMAQFAMCPECQQEYENPLDRRFHAQPNACPKCGPQLALWNSRGEILAQQAAAMERAVAAIKQGLIVAVKGLGGFHLMVDARNLEAVAQLRERKKRPIKPLALMYPNLELVAKDCIMEGIASDLLRSPQAPIVLLPRRLQVQIAANISFQNPYLGVMLPYTPLHHLLMEALGFPIVATSGNLSSEPICIDEREAKQRLQGIADLFLVHNRPIVRPLDDSVVTIVENQPMLLRRARGYAPLPIKINLASESRKILAVGAHFKNTAAITVDSQIFLSQHIGDLSNAIAWKAFERVVDTLKQLYEFEPEAIACDLHPDYLSSQYAQALSLPTIRVQHHQAHVLAVMAEQQILGERALGIAWDGTGLGSDGTIWGGEFFLVPENSVNLERVASLRPFPLPGGDGAIKQPRKAMLGLLYSLWGKDVLTHPLSNSCFTLQELTTLTQVLQRKINTPPTSSMGRFFDAVAVMLGLSGTISFEGQAAIELQHLVDATTLGDYPFDCIGNPRLIDWQPLVMSILRDKESGIPVSVIAAKFHHTLAEIIVTIAGEIGEKRVILAGGCFQNQYLLEKTIQRLREAGFIAYWPSLIPPNDGSIALGQAIAALYSKPFHVKID